MDEDGAVDDERSRKGALVKQDEVLTVPEVFGVLLMLVAINVARPSRVVPRPR